MSINFFFRNSFRVCFKSETGTVTNRPQTEAYKAALNDGQKPHKVAAKSGQK